MSAPERKRPTKANSPIQLAPEIEDYGVLSAIPAAEPREPGEPLAPREPLAPTGAREPAERLSGTEPRGSGEPQASVGAGEPREPLAPLGSQGSLEPVAPRRSVEPREPAFPFGFGAGLVEKQKRSVTLPAEQIRRAQIAQKASDHLGGEYQTFSDLVTGAIERELHRLSVLYNNGRPWAEYQGTYRTGRVQETINSGASHA